MGLVIRAIIAIFEQDSLNTDNTDAESKQRKTSSSSRHYTAENILPSASFEINSEQKTKADFHKTISFFKKEWAGKYKHEKYKLSEYEVLYKFNDDIFLFIGAALKDYWTDRKGTFIRHVVVEELTYNYLFKISATKLGNNLDNSFYDIDVIFFYYYGGKVMMKEGNHTFLFYVDRLLPQLNIVNIAENWEGILVNFVVLEVYDESGVASTVRYTERKDVESFARRCCSEAENMRFTTEPHNKINHIQFVNKIKKIRAEYLENKNKTAWTLRGHLRYFYLSENVPDYDCQSRGLQILTNLNAGMYDNIERLEHGRFDGKWKSELRVYEICQKLYGKDNVLFQYSPSFLGQMSYDVFILSLNVAIEYQGKQHFEPVEYFGGEEHFKKQIERDELKRQLSKKNKVKLVYITYKEIVDEKTVQKKVEDATKKSKSEVT